MSGKDNVEIAAMYEAAAIAHSRATERGDSSEANKAYEIIAGAYRELRSRGREAQSTLLPLLESLEPGVRCWAAAHALEFAPERGRAVLETLSKEPPWIGIDAKTTLKVWREGKLKFP